MKNKIINEKTGEVFEKLIDVSSTGRVLNWKLKKERSLYLEKIFKSLNLDSKANRIDTCGTYLEYRVLSDDSMKLNRANFCKIRLCPMCSWRRSLKIYGQMSSIINKANESGYEYLFITLTIKNVEGKYLDETIKSLSKGFNRFTKYKAIDKIAKGWYRALEVTYNAKNNTYHPHYHMVMAVNRRYFKSKDYLSQKSFTELWKKAMKLNYVPEVDVRKIKGDTIDSMSKSIAEIAKYTVKDSDYLREDFELSKKIVSVLDSALANKRLVAFGGVFKQIHKELNLDDAENGDLVNTDVDENISEESMRLIVYVWNAGVKDYVKL